MAARIHRVTMFKVPNVENQNKLVEAYKILFKDHKNADGKPYILSMTTGKVMDDMRTQGWAVVSKAEFANLNDMRYYDEECPAHAQLKEKAKALVAADASPPVMTVYFEAAFSSSTQ
ncbi:hypothetical protein F5Y16DRAFT_405626 [Xylariaceae sp. FL0255]|nr:hypothetical protein F5Y16DRAFT_405626 [Xylariaceae sp. FL0255]